MFLFTILLACKSEKHNSLQFLDEYILKDSLNFKNSIVGGISGIDYANGYYYLVVDDAENPRFLKTEIKINKNKIDTLIIKDVIYLKDSLQPFFKENHLDLESIFIDKNKINFSSEGAIINNKRPSIFTTDFKGNFIEEYQLPKPFLNLENIVNNGVFEGSALSYHKKGFWSIMETPLKKDGVEATFTKTQSPVRITYFNHKTKKATKQFAYQLEKITKPAKGNINLSGVTAILEYKENTFFVVERTYQSNYGAYGNIVRIFESEITPATTNILELHVLKDPKY